MFWTLCDLLALEVAWHLPLSLDLFHCIEGVDAQLLVPLPTSLEHLHELNFGHHTAVVFIHKSDGYVSEHLLFSYLLEEILYKHTMPRCVALCIEWIANDDALHVLAANRVPQVLAEAEEVILPIIDLNCLVPSRQLHFPVTDREAGVFPSDIKTHDSCLRIVALNVLKLGSEISMSCILDNVFACSRGRH